MNKIIAIKKCKTYDFEQVFSAIKQLFELVPPPDVKDKIVLLKPNILYPKKPELAVCTHPVIVGATVKAFIELGAAKVWVGESPAIANSIISAKATGMYDQVISNGGEWVDFNKKVTVEIPEGRIIKAIDIAQQVTQADIVVSLSKLKSHQLMAYTGAMKNLFGTVLNLEKTQQHYRFPNRKDFGTYLTDLNIAVNPQYAIMDAIVGMDGPGGPGSGDPIELGFIAASDNILALDWKCASLVGYNPHNVTNLEDALERKIWLDSEDEIRVLGESEDSVRCTSFRIVKTPTESLSKMLPKALDSVAKMVFLKTPHFSVKKCKKCGKCKMICSAHLITMDGKNNTARLSDKSKCLHCFCCHEICPEGAISLKRF